MAKLVFTDTDILMDEIDASGDTNKVELAVSADMLESTNFESQGWREVEGGLKRVEMSLEGFWDEANLMAEMFDWVGGRGTVATVSPLGTENDVAYLFQPYRASVNLNGEVGQLGKYSAMAKGFDPTGLVRGRLLAAKQTVSGASDTTGYQLGAVGATQTLVINVHVITAGTTIDVLVESDDNSGFTTPTERANETLTVVGGTRVEVAGAITDDYYRVGFENVTGSFVVAVGVGIV